MLGLEFCLPITIKIYKNEKMQNVSHEPPGFVLKILPEPEFWFHHQNPFNIDTKNGFPPETSSTLGGKSKVSHETSSFRTSDGKKDNKKDKKRQDELSKCFPTV